MRRARGRPRRRGAPSATRAGSRCLRGCRRSSARSDGPRAAAHARAPARSRPGGGAPARAPRRARRSRPRSQRSRNPRASAAILRPGMALPLKPPVQPQLALSRKALPEGEDWVYEPKYDGFRALAFVDGGDVYLQSRGAKPLRRYFPEVEFPKGRYVLDGELVILGADGREEFDALQNRLHPAESRVRMLAEQTPALFRAFDLLAVDRRKLTGKPFSERRSELEKLIAAAPGRKKSASGSVELTPLYKTARSAEPLLRSGEGVIAKELDAIYKPGQRKGMVKIKRVRTIDCVIVGWRPGKEKGTVGSLILGLYDKG